MQKPQLSGKHLILLVSLFIMLGLVACSGNEPEPPATQASTNTNQVSTNQTNAGQINANQANTSQGAVAEDDQFGGTPFESTYLTNNYENALPTTMQLTLGTLKLEEGDSAVTPEQAGQLLPLWQALQSGSITNATERNAVYKSIEGTMDDTQLLAIAAMELTFIDMNEWATANGLELRQGGPARGERQGAGAAAGGDNPFAALTDEQRTQLRELSQEERQAQLREWGIEIPEGGLGGRGQGAGPRGNGPAADDNQPRGGRVNVLMEPLVELLTTRAAE